MGLVEYTQANPDIHVNIKKKLFVLTIEPKL